MTNLQSQRNRKKAGEITGVILEWIAMILILVLVLYPLIFVLSTSFKTYGEFIKSPFSLSLAHPENYYKAFVEGNLGRSIVNTVIVAVVAVVCQTIITGLAVYGIGVLKFKGSGIFIGILLFTMFVSGEMTTIPNILLIRALGLYDTLGALLFPAALGVSGIGVFIGVNYANAIPKELHEAASLDGASIPQTFFHIDLHLLKPVLTYVAIGAFSASWSDFFGPLVFIPMNEKAYTLAITIQKFDTVNNSEYGTLCAGLVILAVPVVVVYAVFSKYFLEGVAVGAVKG